MAPFCLSRLQAGSQETVARKPTTNIGTLIDEAEPQLRHTSSSASGFLGHKGSGEMLVEVRVGGCALGGLFSLGFGKRARVSRFRRVAAGCSFLLALRRSTQARRTSESVLASYCKPYK